MMNYFANEICGFRANIIFHTGGKICGKCIICPQNRESATTGLIFFLAWKKKNKKKQDCKSYSKFRIQISDTLLQAHDQNLEKTYQVHLLRGKAEVRPGPLLKISSLEWAPNRRADLVWPLGHSPAQIQWEQKRETGELWVRKDILRQRSHSCVKNLSTQDNKIVFDK